MKTEAECVRRNDGENCDRDCGKCDLLRDAAEILEAYAVVIEAAEKQIQKNPVMKNEDLCCPSCGGILTNYFHCLRCGQSLKWGD